MRENTLDVRDIIADDEALQAGILPSLQEYNLEQFITVDLPGCEHQVSIVCRFSYYRV